MQCHQVTCLLAAAGVALVLTACGSSSPAASVSASSSAETQAHVQQSLVSFSDCMRSHGVPTFPDPTGPDFKYALAPSTPHSPAFGPAYAVCRHLLRDNGASEQNAARSPAQITALLAFVRCLRSHGFPSFPDPSPTGELTHEMVARAGINVHQPAVRQAGDACVSVSRGVITRTDVARFVAGE